jgi:hypothetical protein
MIIRDQKGSWKGRIWSLFFIWPFIVLITVLSFDFEKATMTQSIGVIVFSLTVIPWLIILVKQIKKRK